MEKPHFTIWTNAKFPQEVTDRLSASIAPHRLLFASQLSSLNLSASPPDLQLAEADIAFGQPDPEQILRSPKLRWIHLTTAGYTPYDREDLRNALSERKAMLTTSSGVYDEPCAEHLLAMMISFARQLPQSLGTQWSDRSWPATERRRKSFLLKGQTAILFGFGEIAIRLAELLAPMGMNLIGVRRRPKGNESIPLIEEGEVHEYLPRADHVVNTLPANASTIDYFDAAKFKRMKQGAYFYNIGRGGTVHQPALQEALRSGVLSAAYLDVMTPEPLPVDHPLWQTPNCFITPHSAGGFDGEMMRLVEHFLENLKKFTAKEPLLNQVCSNVVPSVSRNLS